MRVDLVHGVEICPSAKFGSDIFGHVEVSRETISPWCWWIAVNMMYSDYYGVASQFGVATPEFFAELAKAFLLDEDGPGPKPKMSAYYCGIVKGKH